MQIFRFDAEVAHKVSQYGSSFLHAFLSVTRDGGLQVSVMHFAAGDHVGYHQAVVPQLFAVVAGDGWVEAEARKEIVISAGSAAFWKAGEWHAARAETAMTAVVLEGARLDPAGFMPEA